MIVRIKDLVLWQWRPTMIAKDYEVVRFNRDDDKQVRGIMVKYRKYGLLTRAVPPIRVARFGSKELYEAYFDFPLSKKGINEILAGKWMVWDGFHRIYAARRLGYKTIRAEDNSVSSTEYMLHKMAAEMGV